MSHRAFVRCLVLFPLLAARGTAAQEIKLEYDHEVDFSRYQSFAWSPAQQPAKNQANHVRITRAVEQAFSGKGLAKNADGRPEALLMYHGRVGDKVKVTGHSAGSYWEPTNLRTMVDLNRVREGTLVLEMYDAHTKDVVWRGVASSVGLREDRMEEEITAAVKKLLEGYPPTKASPAPAEPPKP